MALTPNDFLNFEAAPTPVETSLGTVYVRQFSAEDSFRINEHATPGANFNAKQLALMLSIGTCHEDGSEFFTEAEAAKFIAKRGSQRITQQIVEVINRENGFGEKAEAELAKNSETPAGGDGSSA